MFKYSQGTSINEIKIHDSSRQDKSDERKINVNILEDERNSGENSPTQYLKAGTNRIC